VVVRERGSPRKGKTMTETIATAALVLAGHTFFVWQIIRANRVPE
jgi:hypothetical protein